MATNRIRKPNFKSFESRSANSKHARITKDMVSSLAWETLDVYGQILYLNLKMRYTGKPGDERNIRFPYKEGLAIMSKRKFTESMDRLIEVGLVDLVEHRPFSALCNVYGLSDRWHHYGTPGFVKKARLKFGGEFKKVEDLPDYQKPAPPSR